LLALLAGPSLGVGFGTDNRKPMPANPDAVWKTIGKIVVKGGQASGCLIGPHLVLTAKHAVYDTETGDPYEDMQFVTACDGPRGHREAARVVHVYHLKERSAASGFGYDWAILVLDRSLGNVFGWLGVKSFDDGESPFDFKPTFYGYASNPHELVPEFRSCNAPFSAEGHFRLTSQPNIIIHDCASWPGSSGGPLIVWSHGKPWVAGVHVAGMRDASVPAALNPRGGFVTKVAGDTQFYKKYGNWCVPMDRPIHTLQDLPVPTARRLSVENQDSQTIFVAAAFHSDNFGEDKVVGYVQVPPGQQAVLIDEKDGLTQSSLYLHAHAQDGYSWSSKGTARLRVANEEATFVPFPLTTARHHLVLKRKAGS